MFIHPKFDDSEFPECSCNWNYHNIVPSRFRCQYCRSHFITIRKTLVTSPDAKSRQYFSVLLSDLTISNNLLTSRYFATALFDLDLFQTVLILQTTSESLICKNKQYPACWLVGWPAACLAGCLAAWLLAGWLDGSLAAGWLAGWLADWLAGWLAGRGRNTSQEGRGREGGVGGTRDSCGRKPQESVKCSP